jgi:hypothetical protein
MKIYKSSKEELQQVYTLIFGKNENISTRAEEIRSGIYKIGAVLGASVVLLALLLLKFTG